MLSLTDLPNLLSSGAALAALGWLGTKIYEFGVAWFEKRDKRKAAIVRFLTDLRIRIGDLSKIADTNYVESTVEKIKDYGKRGKTFAFYGVQITDTYAENEISSYLHKFTPFTGDLIRNFILYDSLVSKAYEKMQTSEFANLDSDRQVQAFRAWVDAGLLTVTFGRQLKEHLESLYPNLAIRQAAYAAINAPTAEE